MLWKISKVPLLGSYFEDFLQISNHFASVLYLFLRGFRNHWAVLMDPLLFDTRHNQNDLFYVISVSLIYN